MEIIGAIAFILGLALMYAGAVMTSHAEAVWQGVVIMVMAIIGCITCVVGVELMAGVPLTEVF